MNPNLQNDLIEFKAWYQYKVEILNKVLAAAEHEDEPDEHEIAQLKRAKLLLIEKAARMIVDLYAKYRYYPYL